MSYTLEINHNNLIDSKVLLDAIEVIKNKSKFSYHTICDNRLQILFGLIPVLQIEYNTNRIIIDANSNLKIFAKYFVQELNSILDIKILDPQLMEVIDFSRESIEYSDLLKQAANLDKNVKIITRFKSDAFNIESPNLNKLVVDTSNKYFSNFISDIDQQPMDAPNLSISIRDQNDQPYISITSLGKIGPKLISPRSMTITIYGDMNKAINQFIDEISNVISSSFVKTVTME